MTVDVIGITDDVDGLESGGRKPFSPVDAGHMRTSVGQVEDVDLSKSAVSDATDAFGDEERDPLRAASLKCSRTDPDGKAGDVLAPSSPTIVNYGNVGVCEEASKEDEMCGWGAFRPRCFQVFRNAKVVLVCLCLVATIQVRTLSF